MTKMYRVILVSIFTLIGCQNLNGSKGLDSDININISASNIGKITAKTPFDIQLIRELFTAYEINKHFQVTESEMYPVFLVKQDGETLLTINPTSDQTAIHSVIVESHRINPYKMYSFGMGFKQVRNDISLNQCYPGQEEWSGMVICTANSSPNIGYVFSGQWSDSDGGLPPQRFLNLWKLSKLIWWASIIEPR